MVTNNSVVESRFIWDEWYYTRNKENLKHNDDSWLDRWWYILASSTDMPILDIGCGGGFDSDYLIKRGFRVIASDYSWEALRISRQIAPSARVILFDIRDGLPFQPSLFQVIIANLSLHYFPWEQTLQIIEDVRSKLRTGGFLLARLNSKADNNFTEAKSRSYLQIEPDYFLVDKLPRRFFDEESISKLFQSGWKLLHMEEKIISPYYTPKVVWEIALRKANTNA